MFFPSHSLSPTQQDGLANVASRIKYLFARLRSLDNCVILFDEIEEFCLDRETPGLGMESRLLTTSMLTQINDLRRAKRSIFFLATNRLRAFDSAIIRVSAGICRACCVSLLSPAAVL